MHDFFEEAKNIEQKNNKSFDRIDELSLKDIKSKFNQLRGSVKDYFNSDTFKNLKGDVKNAVSNAFKGDISAAKQELEKVKGEMSPKEFEETTSAFNDMEGASKLKDAASKSDNPEVENDVDNDSDFAIGLQKNNDGTYLVAGKNPARNITVLAGMSESQNYNWKTGDLNWLAEGKFVAESITIDFKTERVLSFTGKWLDGEFKGAKFVSSKDGSDAQFLGGTFNGGEFKSKNESFKVSPTNFVNGLFPYEGDGSWGGILGLEDVGVSDQTDGFYITQVRPGNIIKITSSDGLNYPIKVVKRIDGRSSGFLFELMIEGEGGGRFPIKWTEMRGKWESMFIAPGKSLSLPFVTIKKIGTVSIAPNYDKEVETAREPKMFSISRDEFKIPGFVNTLKDNRISKFKVNIPDASKEAREFFKIFKSDVNAGKNKLENHLKVLKSSIGDQLQETTQPIQIEGYPEKYKWLKMVFLGSQIEPSGKDLNLDADEERALAYLNGFMKNIYTNIVDPNIRKGLLMAIREFIGVNQISTTPTPTPSPDSKGDAKTSDKPKEKEVEKKPEDVKKLVKGLMLKEFKDIFNK